MRRDKSLCQPCLRNNRTALASQVDHVKPKAKGGTDDMSNLEAICSTCHHEKTIKDSGGRVKPQIGADGWPVDR